MPKVTKLQKIASADAPAGLPDEPSFGADQNRNCLFVLGYFVFVYLAMVLAFWMFGNITHLSDRRLDTMHNAQSATEIRDALAAEFGAPRWITLTLPSPIDVISNSAAAISNTVTDSVTNAAKDAITNGIKEGTTSAVNDALPK